MMNQKILTVAVLAMFLVTVGAAQLVFGQSEDTQAAAEEFPVAMPYIEPTATATATSEPPAIEPTATATPVELPQGDVPGEDIPDVPRYPDSVRVAYGADSTGTEIRISVEYVTLDALEPVHEHVRNIVNTFGWHVAGEDFTAATLRFVLEREGEHVEMSLSQSAGLTLISIDYSRVEPVVEEESVPEPAIEPEPQVDPPPPVPDAPPSGPPEHATEDQQEPSEEPGNAPEQKPEKPEEPEKPENHPGNNGNGNGGNNGNNGNGNNGNGNNGNQGNGNGGNNGNSGNGNQGNGNGNSGNGGNQGNGGGNDKKDND